MTQYRFTSSAHTELRQAILYYERRENGLGTAFLNEIEATQIEFCKTRPPGISCPDEQGAVELTAFPLDLYTRFAEKKFSSFQLWTYVAIL